MAGTGPDQSLEETLAVDDVMLILEGKVSVESRAGSITACPGEIVYMPKGETVIIRSHAEGARHRLCHLSALAGGA